MGSFKNYFEFYGDGNHGYCNPKLNTHGFRVVAVPIGFDYQYTDAATLFVASNFEDMPEEDRKSSTIIEKIEVDVSNFTDRFLFLAEVSDENNRVIVVRNFSQRKNQSFALFTF
jgi:hypothetical protein